MKTRRITFRRVVGIVLGVLVVVFGPYLASRALSPWRMIQAYEVTTASVAPTTPSETVRIVAYNIAHGRGLAPDNWSGGSAEERRQRLDAIAALLIEIDADVVVLNEADFDASWSHRVNQAQYLAEAAGYRHVVEQRNLDFRMLWRTWRFGNAVFSRHPIVDHGVIDLPGYSALETLTAGKKRGVAATIDYHGQPLHVWGVHLSHRSESLRSRSAQVLLDQLPPSTVIAGDFNSTPTGFPRSQTSADQGNAIDRLDAAQRLQRRPVEPPTDPQQLTFRADDPKNVIDWVMITPDLAFADYRVIPSTLSDHRPVVADITLQP